MLNFTYFQYLIGQLDLEHVYNDQLFQLDQTQYIRQVYYKLPPPLGYFVFVSEKRTFEVDASQNSNTLTETKTGWQKLKANDINYDYCDDTANQPVFLNK